MRFPLNSLLELLMLERYRSYLGSQKWGEKKPQGFRMKGTTGKNVLTLDTFEQ